MPPAPHYEAQVPSVENSIDASYLGKSPAGETTIPVETGDEVIVFVSGPASTVGRTYSFRVITSWESSHKDGCKTIKETHFFPRDRVKTTEAFLFRHYWPALIVPGERPDAPTVVPLKLREQKLVILYRGTLTVGDLVIPAPYLLYLPGQPGGELTEDERAFQRAKERELPAPNHHYVRTENQSLKPGSVSLRVKVTVRRPKGGP